MRICCLLIAVFLLAPAAVNAEETAVYESFAGVKIGRVFLAPGDRDRLDEQRLNPPAEGASGASESEGAAEKAPEVASAGYIISSSGRARVWRDGDFVAAPRQAPGDMAFPGDVKVVRTVGADPVASREDQRERRGEADSNAD